MQLLSEEIIERLKEKIPKIRSIDPSIYGMLHLDIVSEDKKSIKQLGKRNIANKSRINSFIFLSAVLMIERCKVLEPKQFLRDSQIFADVYIKIEDRILYQVGVKEISVDHALKEIEFYGDDEIWKYQLDALREILKSEQFEVKTKKKSQENIVECTPTNDEVSKVSVEFKFLTDALMKLNKT